MENFTEVHYILMCILLGYGVVLGFRNILIRLWGIVTLRGHNQNALGQLMDGAFIAGTCFLVLTFNGVI